MTSKNFTLEPSRWLAAIAVPCLLLMTACERPPSLPPSSPALWQIENSRGELEGWLFGTIHALPDDIEWRTDTLEDALQRSQLLVVEVANLGDSEALAAIFHELASTPDLATLDQRVAPELVGDLAALMAKGGFDKGDFTETETWAAALTLAQIDTVGDPEHGVDRTLLKRDIPAIELEGARVQLSIFDNLAERDQRDLLEAIIAASADPDRDPAYLAQKWRLGDMAAIEAETTSGMMADPELRAALLDERNIDWVKKLKPLMADNGALMVAVGTGHLVGDGSLPHLLTEEGFTVTRIQ